MDKIKSSSSSEESLSSESSSDSTSSDSDTGPSKWQHWKRWEGPWYKKGQMEQIIVVRSGKKIMLLPCDSDNPNEVSIEAITNSSTIHNMLDDLGTEMNMPIPLTNTTSNILTLVVQYLEYLYDFPKISDWDINTKQEFTQWEKEFIDVDHVTLNDLCLTANFLDIKPLLKLSCNGIAKILEKIPPEKMGKVCQEMFGTANDIPEDECKQMMEDHEKYFGDQ